MLRFLKTLAPPTSDPPDDDTPGPEQGAPAAPAASIPRAWACAPAPGGRYVGLAAGDRLEIWDVAHSEVCVVCRVQLPAPAHTGLIALHPSGNALAFAAQSKIWSIRRDGSGFAASMASAWGQPRALCFDPTGSVIWASFADDARAHVCALDSQMMALIDVQACEGLAGVDHEISFHPAGEPAALARTSESEGTALSLLERAETSLSVSPLQLTAPAPPFFFAGFSADGARVAAVFRERIEQWAWPAREPIGSVTLDEGHAFYRAGCFVRSDLLVLVREEPTAADRLAVLDESLRMRTFFQWKPEDQQRLLGARAMAAGRVLVIGDRRVGLFELGAGEG